MEQSYAQIPNVSNYSLETWKLLHIVTEFMQTRRVQVQLFNVSLGQKYSTRHSKLDPIIIWNIFSLIS